MHSILHHMEQLIQCLINNQKLFIISTKQTNVNMIKYILCNKLLDFLVKAPQVCNLETLAILITQKRITDTQHTWYNS